MSLAGIAAANKEILQRGAYHAPSGREVEIRASVARALEGTRLYLPDELARLLDHTSHTTPGGGPPVVEVWSAKTGEAGRRLAQQRGAPVALLNFASARNPGGGYVRGARAQEEDLTRCSALHETLLTQPEYYDANRACTSLVYTDHMIYSPGVPFFRDEDYALLEQPVPLAVITAPAPNAGEVLRRDPAAGPTIEAALRRRAGMVLAVAEDQGHRDLVLGAWGCGVFRNNPAAVAGAFGDWLESPRFAGAFFHVVFAVWSRGGGGATLAAFQARFAP
jgi:uncharacterized protein (TIGR02452 family)